MTINIFFCALELGSFSPLLVHCSDKQSAISWIKTCTQHKPWPCLFSTAWKKINDGVQI